MHHTLLTLLQLGKAATPGTAEEQGDAHSSVHPMSFLVRSRHSQKWGRTGSIPAATSFSVRTGRRASGESDSVVLRSGELATQESGPAAVGTGVLAVAALTATLHSHRAIDT